MFFGIKDLYLDINCLSCEKNWTSTPSASGLYGGQAGRWKTAEFQILEILYRLNYFDSYFVYSSAVLLIVL